MRILLPDGNERSSLAAARTLVAAGHAVHVMRRHRWDLAATTRGAIPLRLEAHPLRSPAGYAEEVTAAIRALDIGLLLPTTDAGIEALLPRRREWPEGILPLPEAEQWRAAADKGRMLDLAREVGLDAPTTIRIDAPDALPPTVTFPAVLKPHRSVGRENGKQVGLTVVPVADRAACEAQLRALPPSAFPVLLQQVIVGPGEGLFLLRWDGRIVATFAHRRLREKPPWGGVSVYRESIAPPADLLEAGTRLLERLDWRGVAMIECKRDLRTGRHVLMEVNGRLWGSLQLAIDAGVDFPRLLVACRAGTPPSTPPIYRRGIRSRWFWGDLDHLYLRLRHGPARLGALRDFLRLGGAEDQEEIWRWRDPAPFIAESMRWFAGGVSQ